MLKGVVITSYGKVQFVRTDTGVYRCGLKGNLRRLNLRTTNPVAVGDRVLIELSGDMQGLIVEIEERRNYIIRRSTNLSKQAHVLAANIDMVLLLVTLKQPVTTTVFIDRFLATAEAYRIDVTLVFNKIDIYTRNELEAVAELMACYQMAGYRVIETSVIKGTNLNKIKELLNGKVSMISGHSGSGKSSMINALDPGHMLSVGQISEMHLSGKHTTSYAQMIDLSFGGSIIDTPGIRGFGLIDFDKDELYHFFREIFRFSEHCKYYNCKHVNEPGCAVLAAVEEGEIALSRYESYLSLYLGEDDKFRKKSID